MLCGCGIMKFFKPKKLDDKTITVFYKTYLWGYDTSQKNEMPLDIESFKEKLKRKGCEK